MATSWMIFLMSMQLPAASVAQMICAHKVQIQLLSLRQGIACRQGCIQRRRTHTALDHSLAQCFQQDKADFALLRLLVL